MTNPNWFTSQVVPFFVGLGVMLAFIFGVAYATIWLRDRGWLAVRRRPVRIQTSVPVGDSPDSLRAGRVYVVLRDFADYYGDTFGAGETLTFVRHDVVPYHGGHVLVFQEKLVSLQEEENSDILGHLERYLAPSPPAPRGKP